MNRPRTIDPALYATARMVENLAALAIDVRRHARAEIALVDGNPDHTPGSVEPAVTTRGQIISGRCAASVPTHGTRNAPLEALELTECGRRRPCSEHDAPVDLTAVERAAEQRLRMERWLADFDAQCNLLAVAARKALDDARTLIGTRLEVDARPPECRDGQTGKDGTIEWGDVLCCSPAEKSGLCAKHYMAWYRWRRNNGGDVTGMFSEPGQAREAV